jgi:hypothetical protein
MSPSAVLERAFLAFLGLGFAAAGNPGSRQTLLNF